MLKKLTIIILLFNSYILQANDQNSKDAVSNLKAYAHFKSGDYSEAKVIWEELAKKGNTTALINLANLFEHGNGVNKDDLKALEYIKEAAKLNDERAQYELGIHYEKGILLKRDIDKAEYWLKLSARNGNSQGQLAYAILLTTGKGKGIEKLNKKEIEIALKELKKAKNLGEEEAKNYIKLLENEK